MSLHLRFWKEELPIRLRGWWHRHWPYAVIRQRDRERADWKRWCYEAEERANPRDVAILGGDPTP